MNKTPRYPNDGQVNSYNFNIDNINSKVEAIQWLGDNVKECNDFVSETDNEAFVFLRDQTLIYEYEKGAAIKEIHPYDYIVKFKDSNICHVLPYDTFKFMFGQYDSFSLTDTEPRTNSPDRTDDNNVKLNIKDNYGNSLKLISNEKPFSTDYGTLTDYYEYKSCYGDNLVYMHYKDKDERIYMKDQYGNKCDFVIGPINTNVSFNKNNILDKIKGLTDKSQSMIIKVNEKINSLAFKSKNLQ